MANEWLGYALGGLEDLMTKRRKQRMEQEAINRQIEQQGIENQQRNRQLDVMERNIPAERPIEVNGALVSPKGEVLYQSPPTAPPPERPYAVGGRLLSPTGQVLFEPPPEAPSEPEMKEIGGYIYRGNERIGPARNMSAEAAAAAAARGGGKESAADVYSAERANRTIQSVSELQNLLKTSGRMAAGGASSVLAALPETQARYFRSQLDTLKSNIAFSELVEMRNASKTGGALGNVSDRESQLLSQSLGALDPNLSPAQLQEQLNKIKGSLERWRDAKASGGAQPAATVAPESQTQGPKRSAEDWYNSKFGNR